MLPKEQCWPYFYLLSLFSIQKWLFFIYENQTQNIVYVDFILQIWIIVNMLSILGMKQLKMNFAIQK